MFIELTDILRCPADHDEAYLVLLPDEVVDRSVRHGQLGCPLCGRTYPITAGVAAFVEGEPAADPGTLAAEAAATLVGLQGPGGYLVVVGNLADGTEALVGLVEGVQMMVVNPARGVVGGPGWSVVRAGGIPAKARSVRGVVLGPEASASPHWLAEAVRVTLPGLRVVGQGPEPSQPGLEPLASADGVWVAAVRR